MLEFYLKKISRSPAGTCCLVRGFVLMTAGCAVHSGVQSVEMKKPREISGAAVY